MELKTLSVEALKALRTKIRVEIADRLSTQAHFTFFEFLQEDGGVHFKAMTKHGLIEYKTDVYGTLEGQLTLDGGGELDDGLHALEIPILDELTDPNEARELCAEAVIVWERDYEKPEKKDA